LHQDSLLQPPHRGKPDRALRALGVEPVLLPAALARGDTDSEPVLADGPSVLRLE
jgi:hypothetical protein